MKNLRFVGFALMLSGLFSVSFASNSTITDLEAGMATDIVMDKSIIHVYNYKGMSSVRGLMSTFNQGEDWTNAIIPEPPRVLPFSQSVSAETKAKFKADTHQVTGLETFNYVEIVDECREEGAVWNFRTDTCSQ